jgi:plastocyanin
MARKLCVATALAVAVFAAAAAFPAASAQAADMEVKIDEFAFDPQRVTVKAGTTVTWTNEDDVPHTIASSSKLFKSKALDTGDKFSFTFTTPGTYEYFCSLHPHMTGVIVELKRRPEATRLNNARSTATTGPGATLESRGRHDGG